MAIAVNLFQLQVDDQNVYAFKPESISFGEGETLEAKINRNGGITTVPLIKRTATLTLEGATQSDLTLLENIRENNVKALLLNTIVPQDLNIKGYVVQQAVLTKVTPSAPMTVEGINIFDTIELEYQSQVYS